MILTELKRLAETENLLENPHYEPKPVPWLIVVDEDGKCLGIQSTSVPDQRGKPRPKSFSIPRRSGRTSGDQAEFLVDKAEYVFGIGDRDEAKRKRRRELFVAEVVAAADATHDPGVLAVRKFLEAPPPALPAEMTAGDLCAFVFAPDVDRLVSDRPAVQAYWGQRRELTAGSVLPRCIICGRPAPPVDKHPGIKKMPGANTAGAAIVSFNNPSGESYGWARNDNATVCRPCADAYTTALNRLLHPAYPRPSDNLPMPKRNYRLSDDTTAVFWERSGGEFPDVFAELLDGNPDAIHALLGSPWHGKPVNLDNPDAFFVLILSGAQGRVIIRDWIESTVRDVAGNLKQYFDDLALVKMRDQEPEALPLRWLLDGLVPEGESSALPPSLASGLFEAALFGRRYPLALLDAALRRLRAGDECNRARVSIIKAVLKRNYQQEVTPAMDTNCTNVGYRLGRLFAVLEKLQQAAINNPNVTIVDRFFGAASATPVVVFPRLLRLAQHHATKAEKLGGYYQKLIEEILEPLDPQNTFPSALELHDQGMFALGYYHQRAELWKKKSE